MNIKLGCRLIAVLFMLNTSCTGNEKPETINPQYEVLNDQILIANPSFLLLSGDYLFLSDAKSTDSLVQVFNSKTGERLSSLGKLGNGPGEFMSYILFNGGNGSFIAHDINTLKTGVFQHSVENDEGPAFTDITDQVIPDFLSMQILHDDKYLFLNPDNKEALFQLVDKKKNSIKRFGDIPGKDKNIPFDNFQLQGHVGYDLYNGYLLFKFSSIPQLRLYREAGDSFKLVAEKDLSKYEFIEMDNMLTVDYLEPCRVKMASLTKDYVVLLDDGNMTTEQRQSFNSPVVSRRQIVLCDYKLNPKKILDLDMDIYVIASDSRTNDLYLIGSNPDYAIIKVDLDNM